MLFIILYSTLPSVHTLILLVMPVCAGLVTCCVARHVQQSTTWRVLIHLWSRCLRKTGCAVSAEPTRSRVSLIASLKLRGVVCFVARSPLDMIAMPGNTGSCAGESLCGCSELEKSLAIAPRGCFH